MVFFLRLANERNRFRVLAMNLKLTNSFVICGRCIYCDGCIYNQISRKFLHGCEEMRCSRQHNQHAMPKNLKKPRENDRKTVAYRLRQETLNLLQDVSAATGITMTEIVERSVQAHVGDLVKKVEAERTAAKKRLQGRL